MTQSIALQAVQVAIGLALVSYSLALLVRRALRAGWTIPRWPAAHDSATDDLRLLIDMAARFRDAGNPEAVRACQALIDQLLNPKPVSTP